MEITDKINLSSDGELYWDYSCPIDTMCINYDGDTHYDNDGDPYCINYIVYYPVLPDADSDGMDDVQCDYSTVYDISTVDGNIINWTHDTDTNTITVIIDTYWT